MAPLNTLPDKAFRRLAKVIVRTIHLVGVAGFFGYAMMGRYVSTYIVLTIVTGAVLTLKPPLTGSGLSNSEASSYTSSYCFYCSYISNPPHLSPA